MNIYAAAYVCLLALMIVYEINDDSEWDEIELEFVCANLLGEGVDYYEFA